MLDALKIDGSGMAFLVWGFLVCWVLQYEEALGEFWRRARSLAGIWGRALLLKQNKVLAYMYYQAIFREVQDAEK